jgi:hypothetical protein
MQKTPAYGPELLSVAGVTALAGLFLVNFSSSPDPPGGVTPTPSVVTRNSGRRIKDSVEVRAADSFVMD